MKSKDEIDRRIKTLKTKLGIADESNEHVIATLHIHSEHNLAVESAQDRTSTGANDNGIDAWHLDAREGILFVYQSKLSWSKGIVASGFSSLLQAAGWLTNVLASGELVKVPTNPCIY